MKVNYFWVGLGMVILVVLGLLYFKPSPQTSNLILTAVNLILVIGYVFATFEMMNMNKLLVSLTMTPILAVNIVNLEVKDQPINYNEPRLILDNKSKNHAKEVKVRVRAVINNQRELDASAPLNGQRNFYVQAGYTVFHKIKLEEEFLGRADLSILRMIELSNESNKENQLILRVSVSHLDGFGKRINLPELSWYFDFIGKAWNFIG